VLKGEHIKGSREYIRSEILRIHFPVYIQNICIEDISIYFGALYHIWCKFPEATVFNLK